MRSDGLEKNGTNRKSLLVRIMRLHAFFSNQHVELKLGNVHVYIADTYCTCFLAYALHNAYHVETDANFVWSFMSRLGSKLNAIIH